MIPIQLNYSIELREQFSKDVEWFATFIRNYSQNDSKSRQLLLLATDEYYRYLDTIKNYSTDIVSIFGHCCTYCNSREIVSTLPIHPLDKNRFFPELAQEIRNIVPLCNTCRKLTVALEYQDSSTEFQDYYFSQDCHEQFNSLILRRPNILIPIQEPSHLQLSINEESGILRGTNAISNRTIKICGLNKKKLFTKSTQFYQESEIPFINNKSKHNYWKLWASLKSGQTDFESDYSQAKLLEEIQSNKEENVDHILIKDFRLKRISNETITEDEPIELDLFSHKGIRNIQDGEINLKNIKALGIVGENGVGKSTFLNFLSVSIRGTRKSKIQDYSDGCIENGCRKATGSLLLTSENINYKNHIVSIKHATDLNQCEVDIGKKIRIAYINEQRVQTQALTSAKKWLEELPESKFDEVASQIKQILNIDYDSTLTKHNKSVLVLDSSGETKEISTLSSGYKSILTIIYNIYRQFGSNYKLSPDYVNINSIVGIVFIDEIELHLHPIWKISIVGSLKRVFPDVLFIFTTHDPLVLKGCSYGEIALFSRTNTNKTIIDQNLPDISRYNAERILTSRYFGMGATSSIEESRSIQELHKTIRENDKSSILNKVKKLKDEGLYGSTYREMIAFMCVDKSLSLGKDINIDEIVKVINSKVPTYD